MGRTVSTDLQNLLNLPACRTDTTLDLVLADASELHYSTAKENFSINGDTYAGELRKCEEIKQTISSSPNRLQAVIQNVDKIVGSVVADEDLVNAEAIVGRYHRDVAGGLPAVWVELFRGRAIPLSVDELGVTIEIVNDLAAAGYCVAEWTLADPCQFVFKHAGTCGYSGGLTTCNKKRKSPDGCFGRDNEHRFGGMEFPELQTPEVGTGTSDPGDPPVRPPRPCFTGETLVDVDDHYSVTFEKLWRLRKTMIGGPVRSFDDDGRVRQDTIVEVMRHWVHEYLLVRFEGDETPTRVTREHPYWTELRRFVAMGRLRVGDRVQENRYGDWTLPAITSIERVAVPEGCWVYNLETREFHHYFANRKAVHNYKLPGDLDY